MLRSTLGNRADASFLSGGSKRDSIFSRETMLPSEASTLLDSSRQLQAASQSEARRNGNSRLGESAQTETTSQNGAARHTEPGVGTSEEEIKPAVPINKLLDNINLSLGQYSASEEDSKNLVSDRVQWQLDYEIDVPTQIKKQVLAYKQGNDGPVRLERKLNGAEGVLAYILKDRLLIWLFRENKTLEHDFDEQIQCVEFTKLPPQLGVAGIAKCVLAVSLASRMVFMTLTELEGQLILVDNQAFIHEQVEGIHYDVELQRLFIACRGKDSLQETVVDKNGIYRKHSCSLSDLIDPKAVRVKMAKEANTSLNIIEWVKDEFLPKSYSYRTHIFCTDMKKTHLYHLVSRMKGTDGFADKVIDQTIAVYDIANGNFEYLGVLNLKEILTESNRLVDRTSKRADAPGVVGKAVNIVKDWSRPSNFVDVSMSKIVGVYASHTQEWDLSLTYENGYQKRIQVLFSRGGSEPAVNCKLHHYIGRSIEPYPCKSTNQQGSSGNNTGLQSMFDWNSSTLTCQGFNSINAVVHKQLRGQKTVVIIENRLSLVPSASKYEPDSRRINCIERVQTHSVSCILEAENYIDAVDSQIIFDAHPEPTVGQSLFSGAAYTSTQLDNPIVRNLHQGNLGLTDGLVVAFGDKLQFYRRLRIADLLYCILYHLDLAENSKILPPINQSPAEAEKVLTVKNNALQILQKVLRWDLVLYGLKIRHHNLCAGLFTILVNTKQKPFIISKGLREVYEPIMKFHDILPNYSDYCNTEQLVRVRKVAARVFNEFCQIKTESLLLSLSLAESQILKPYILENSSDNKLLSGTNSASDSHPNPLSYALLLSLTGTMLSIWRQPLFKHTFGGPVDRYLPPELNKIQSWLRNFLSALTYQQATQQSRAVLTRSLLFREEAQANTQDYIPVLSIIKIQDVAEPLYAFSRGLAQNGSENILSSPLKLDRPLEAADPNALAKWCRDAINVLYLLMTLGDNPVVLKRLDVVAQRTLTTQFIGDFIESEASSSQFSPFLLKLLELALEDKPLSELKEITHFQLGLEWAEGLSEPGEIRLLIDFVMLKRLADSKDLKKTLELDESNALEEIISRLKLKPHLLFENHIKEMTPYLLRLDKLDVLGSLLVNRLQYLTTVKNKTQEKLEQEIKHAKLKKDLAGETKALPEDAPAGISIGDGPEVTAAAESKIQPARKEESRKIAADSEANSSDHKLSQLQLRYNQLDSESKSVFSLIFCYLYEIAGLEEVEVHRVQLPSFLRQIKILNTLWELLYCNRKKVVRPSEPQKRVSIIGKGASKPSTVLVREFVERNKEGCRGVLIGLLRQILTSECTELRKSVIAWLLSVGKFALVAEIDEGNNDQALTSNICELLMTEDILDPSTAIDNLKFLVENLSARKEWRATIRAIQLLLENSHTARQQVAGDQQAPSAQIGASSTPLSFAERINQVYNSFLGAKDNTSYLELPAAMVDEFNSRLASIEGIDNNERIELISKANQIIKEHGAVLGQDRLKITKIFAEKDQSARLQAEIIEEIEHLEYELEIVLRIFPKLKTPEGNPSALCGLLYKQPLAYLNTYAEDSEHSLKQFKTKLKLFRKTLHSRVWSQDVLITRVIIPLALSKTHISALFENTHFKGTELVLKLEGLLSQMIRNCANFQTVQSLINLMNPLSQALEPNFELYQQVAHPEMMDQLVELQQAHCIWPSNFMRQFTGVVRLVSNSKRLQGTELARLIYSLLKELEAISLLNPYNQLLQIEMRTYLSFHPSGFVEPKLDPTQKDPYIRLYQEHNIWVSSWAICHLSKSLDVLPASFAACADFARDINLSPKQYTPDFKDLQDWRLLIIVTKVFNALLQSSSTGDKDWLRANNRLIHRVINDLCLKASSSLALSPEMKMYSKFVMLKVKGEWEDFNAVQTKPDATKH